MQAVLKALLGGALALILLCTPLSVLSAQEEMPLSEAAREALISDILDSLPQESPPPLTQPPALTDTAYAKRFPFGQERVLHGIFSGESLFFRLPAYWQPGYAYAQIEYTLSRLIDNVPASLTFAVNDIPVASYAMDYAGAGAQTLYVPIPLSLLREGYNEFSVSGFVRLYDEDGCIDDFSNANWIALSARSGVHIGYDAAPFTGRIDAYPYPILSTMDETGSGACIYVSDALSNGEAAAALHLRAHLAGETAGRDLIAMGTASQLYADPGVRGKILVCQTANLPAEFVPYTKNVDGSAMRLDSYAIVRFLRDSQGVPLLLIVADEGDCLMEAAHMLTDERRVAQEKTAFTWVRRGSAALAAQGDSELAAERHTLGSLVDGGLHFIGPFHQYKDVFLPEPGGLLLSGGGKIVLHFRYSENLDFRRSMITVYWGEIPIASRKLSKERAGGDEFSFALPSDLIGTAATKIRIAFDLEIPDLFCTPRMDEMPWAYVTADSVFYLPAAQGIRLSFETRPAPFQSAGRLNRLLVVLPDSPDAQALDSAGLLLSAYTQNVQPYGQLQVIRAGGFDSTAHADRNLLLFGRYGNHSLIRSINENLSFRYNASGSAFLSSTQLVLSERYAQSIAALELLPSPFDAGRAVLAALYTSPESERALRRFLSDEEKLWQLRGDTALIDTELLLQTLTLLPETAEAPPPDILTALRENRDSVIFTLAASASVLLLLIAVILVLLRIAAQRKKEE